MHVYGLTGRKTSQQKGLYQSFSKLFIPILLLSYGKQSNLNSSVLLEWNCRNINQQLQQSPYCIEDAGSSAQDVSHGKGISACFMYTCTVGVPILESIWSWQWINCLHTHFWLVKGSEYISRHTVGKYLM